MVNITIELSPGMAELVRSGAPELVCRAIARGMDEQNEYTIGVAVRERMSYPRTGPSMPDGLRVQSSRLRRSLTRANARVRAPEVISAIGSNVRYFGVHEFGFDGTVRVPAHQRKLPDRYLLAGGISVSKAEAGRAGLLTRRGTLRAGQGTELKGGVVNVREHNRRVSFPARRMVQQTVVDRVPHYRAAFVRHLQTALS